MLDKYLAKPSFSQQTSTQQKPIFELSILTQFYPPDFAATGQLIEELATQISRLGIKVKVFTGQPGYAFKKDSASARECQENLLVRRSRSSRLCPARIRGKAINGLLFCLRSGLHLLKKSGRGDILLVTTAPPFLPILGYLAKLCFGLPYVCLIYDLYPDVAVELNVVAANNWLVLIWDWLNRQVWQQAQSVIVLSSTMKDKVQAKCPEVCDKISVIHNWANPDWIVPIAKQNNWFAHKYGLVNTFTVLYSGNMGRCHDLETVLQAAKQLQNEPIQFVFVGGGAKQQTCTEQVNRLGLDNCRFLPYQEKQDLPYSLTACDLSLVSIGPGMEGVVAPSKLYGTLAAGRPVAVICEPHSYLRTLVSEANCGATFNHGDGTSLAKFIRRLATNTQLARQLGMAGRRYLESNFTLKIIAEQYSELLHQGVNKPKRYPERNRGIAPFPVASFANGSCEISNKQNKS